MKVGRPALDEDAIRWIEEQNPDIEFDWQKILESQPPPEPPAQDSRNRRVRRDRPERRRPAPQQPRPVAVAPAAEVDSDLDRAEALEQLTHPDAEEQVDAPAMPVEQAIGGAHLVRLRARYAELQARITERGGDAARLEELRAQAVSLNPDTWVTEDEVRKGLEEFEPTIRSLRAALGLRRRRRSRRGGRGSGGGQAEG